MHIETPRAKADWFGYHVQSLKHFRDQSRWMAILIFSFFVLSDLSSGAQGVSVERMLEEAESAMHSGATHVAVAKWLDAAKQLEVAGRREEAAEALIHVAEGYQNIGLYNSALEVLATAKTLHSEMRSPTYVKILGTSGSVLLGLRRMEDADRSLKDALELAPQLDDRSIYAFILNNAGNLKAANQQEERAMSDYARSAEIARANGLSSLEARVSTNMATLSCRSRSYAECETFQHEALRLTRSLINSHDKANLLVSLGLNSVVLTDQSSAGTNLTSQRIFSEALTVSELIGDLRVASYALGYVANLYEKEKRIQEALRLTRKAVSYADSANAPESLYQWQWQTGRLLRTSANTDEAIRAYRSSIATLQNIRQEFPGAYAGSPTSFRDSVGVAYFEMIELLLDRASSLSREQAELYLTEVRDTLEQFKLAELRDYFRDDCVDAYLALASNVDKISEDVAVVYPIVLRNRLELLLQLPSGFERIPVPVTEVALTAEVRRFRDLIQNPRNSDYLIPAQQLYQWLIAPLERFLDPSKIQTLVFVPDGPLRTIPIAALHDGTDFIARRFATAVTPSFRLSDPRPLQRERIRVLALGLTKSVQNRGLDGLVQNFAPLPAVKDEIDAINDLYPGGTSLIDESFVLPNVQASLAKTQFNVVHVASHATFAANSSESFLLTYNDRFNPDALAQLIGRFRLRETPIELLTLSACESAAGDDRAALGLAGVAVKAGAKSAVATLWKVDDTASSDLVASFYRSLQDNKLSKAKALQQAQIEMWKYSFYQHPYYWSSFVLINNWL